jgi:hypothetical protein
MLSYFNWFKIVSCGCTFYSGVSKSCSRIKNEMQKSIEAAEPFKSLASFTPRRTIAHPPVAALSIHWNLLLQPVASAGKWLKRVLTMEERFIQIRVGVTFRCEERAGAKVQVPAQEFESDRLTLCPPVAFSGAWTTT